MSRFRSLALVAFALSLAGTASAQQPAAPSAPATPAAPAAGAVKAADAAAFLGDWTVTLESPMGPAVIALSLKEDAAKAVVGEISSEMMPKTAITDISKAGSDLVLKYSLTFDGNAIPVVVTLTPAADKINASLDFGGGQFQMAGTAVKAK